MQPLGPFTPQDPGQGPGASAVQPADILVVEDDPLFSQLMSALLEEDGHRCDVVGSGAQAAMRLREHTPRLMITDYQLPDMNAEQLAAQLDLPPFLVITGSGSEQVAVSMMKLGARDYLSKDADFTKRLPKVVARVLRELDVEDRLETAERSALETQERLKLVLEGSQDGFWDLDLSRGTRFLSDRCWTLLGLQPGKDQPSRQQILERVHPQDRARVQEAAAAHLAGHTAAIELMVRVADPERSWRWLLLRGRGVARDADGRPLRLSGTLSDATDRKRAEEDAVRDRKMESLGQMAGGIAHDFNNLFQALTTNLELMGPRFAGDARGRATLDRCFGILEKASGLSRRMLDFSGGSLHAEETVDLGALAARCVAEFTPQLQEMNPRAEITCTVVAGLPPTAGDPGALTQVLQSLLHNGTEALGQGHGRLEVEVSAWDPVVSPLDPGGWVGEAQVAACLCLSVKDSGCGIPAEVAARIFDPFFSTKAQGRGLGLSASLGIVRSHGGSIHVESTPSKGSRFRVFLPFSTEAATPLPGAAPPPPAETLCRVILLVDDEDDLRDSLAEILSDILGYKVIEARDGIEAVERFREGAGGISLVIMDVTMPRMSGIQAWDEIRKISPAARGILCSGYSEETGVQLASGHGFLGFLKKPFNLQTLRETIRKALPEGQEP